MIYAAMLFEKYYTILFANVLNEQNPVFHENNS